MNEQLHRLAWLLMGCTILALSGTILNEIAEREGIMALVALSWLNAFMIAVLIKKDELTIGLKIVVFSFLAASLLFALKVHLLDTHQTLWQSLAIN